MTITVSPGIRSVLVYQPLFSLFANYQFVVGGEPLDTRYLILSIVYAVGFLVCGGLLFVHYEQDMAAKL